MQASDSHWLSTETLRIFDFPECVETRTWEQISESMRDKTDDFRSGTLRALTTLDFEAWACFKDHNCLTRVAHQSGDYMCYVFHEKQHTWYPWGLSSEVINAHQCAEL